MPEHAFEDIRAYIADLKARAAKSQTEARRKLNPLFGRDDRRKGPEDFVESSFLYMRSCDADTGRRPMPCPVFWLSPDLRVAPISNLGAPTRELQAGQTYRLTATLRNRGDLIVPSAKVEFWLVTPSLGFDTRFATKIGVTAGMVMPYGATELGLDYTVPPGLSGHRCLFARAFSFAPLDIPVDDFALNPVIDRHVAQLNLDIVAQGTTFQLDWIHHRNAREALEIAPMDAVTLRAIRREEMTPLTIAAPRVRGGIADLLRRIEVSARTPDIPSLKVTTDRTETGIALSSRDREAVPIDTQLALTKQAQAVIAAMEKGKPVGEEGRAILRAYRAMTAQTVRTEVVLGLPDLGLKKDRGIALQVLRRDLASGQITGGIALVIAG